MPRVLVVEDEPDIALGLKDDLERHGYEPREGAGTGLVADLNRGRDGRTIALVDETGVAFLFAPLFHPAMKQVGPVRRALGFRTVFNFLGPLCNPGGVRRQLLGVSSQEHAPHMAAALADLGVDVLISAPQKGWSASPSAGLVMMSDRALERLEKTGSDSFALDLKKWRAIMAAYEGGGHAYHATMPTDSLVRFRDTILEIEALVNPTRDQGGRVISE